MQDENFIMIVTYIFHSCYLLEFSDFSVIFDFYQDVKRDNVQFWVKDYLLSKPQDLYVFCTHSHSDHFNPEVLNWKDEKENIKYIFSKELLDTGTVSNPEGILFLDKGEVFRDKQLQAKAFGSTDTGGSFLLNVGDKLIFHAGDLNNWHWNEEVSKIEASGYENNYLCELELLAESLEHLFLAMFPIDPRLGKDYMKGAEQFVRRVSTDYFLPMHFGDNYDKANAFEKFARQQNCNYLKVTQKGESFNL